MSGGLLLQPWITEDLDYPAYQIRLLNSSLGVQAGVVGANDFKVTAGTGLQVNVEKGKGFVEQTKATQESSNTFYNGLYNVLNPTEQNPYNSVEVPTTNPQIAQIILRVYDINELKISGSTYGRIEWLNGTPNAGATKAHIESGESSLYGAAALPISSSIIAFVVVPKNATVSSEYTIIDSRLLSLQWPLKIKQVTSSYTAKSSGEIIEMETNSGNTITLPGVGTANRVIGAYSSVAETKVTAVGSAKIYGEFISGATTITLGLQQRVILQSNGTNWLIISGEPKREQTYITSSGTSPSGPAINTEYECSTARPVEVTLWFVCQTEQDCTIEVVTGGVKFPAEPLHYPSVAGDFFEPSLTFRVNPGQKWKWNGVKVNSAKALYMVL